MTLGTFIHVLIDRIFSLLYILILARVVISFIPVPYNRYTKPILRFIYDVTEPILSFFRGLLPPIMLGSIGLDLSPLIAILVLGLLHNLIDAVLRFIGI